MAKKIEGDRFGRAIQNFRGTLDYFGYDARLKEFIIWKITEVFQRFGFEPLDTPIIENEYILRGKYGEEGEMRRFRLTLSAPSEAGLRYDHTVPLARFVAMHESDIKRPYRRYAIGPVFRDESPAAGRLRQFTQCDFDTVGSSSTVVDAEVLVMINTVLSELGFSEDNYVIKLNDRRLLNALAEWADFIEVEAKNAMFRAWDKIEKSTISDVTNELAQNLEDLYGPDITKQEKNILVTKKVEAFQYMTLFLQGLQGKNPDEIIKEIKSRFSSDSVSEACTMIEKLIGYIRSMGVPDNTFEFYPLLARGLAYYTGPIFEAMAYVEGSPGSIFGGGRFDDLIEQMGGPSLPASGASFGLDRIMQVMKDLAIVPYDLKETEVFVTIFDLEDDFLVRSSFEIAAELRKAGIRTEVYSGEDTRLSNQLRLASARRVKTSVIIGPNEIDKGLVAIKNMVTKNQVTVSRKDFVEKVLDWTRSSTG